MRRERSRGARAASVTIVAAACLLPLVPAAPAYADPPVRIWTDASGPLFAATNLPPGGTRTECLTIAYESRDDSSLRMAATTSGGDLGAYLDLTIAVGNGGAFRNCHGFTGSEVYSGTVADFSARYGDPSTGLVLDNGPTPTGAISVRITLRLQDDNAAQGKNAESSFVWYATGSDGAAAPVEVPVAGPQPAPTPVATPTPSPTPSLSATPKPVPPPPSGGAPGGTVPRWTDRGDGRSLAGRVYDAVSGAVKRVAPSVFKGARIPLYLLPLVLLFLLLQNEIDRRDPKLALAPAYADPDLPFDFDPTIPAEA